MKPHFFNDFIINRCLDQAAATGWVVKTNPFEGGSDHVPFLSGNIPAVLLWHFTDVYYHTDGDRIEMVSKDTLKNVGVSALVSALTLTSANRGTATYIRQELAQSGRRRMAVEFDLSNKAMEDGGDFEKEKMILAAWMDWYDKAIGTCATIPVDADEAAWKAETLEAAASFRSEFADRIEILNAGHD